jgi:hypothetical protein
MLSRKPQTRLGVALADLIDRRTTGAPLQNPSLQPRFF